MRPGVVGPAARFVGVLPVLARESQVGSDSLVGTFIGGEGRGRNSGKRLGGNLEERINAEDAESAEGAEKRRAARLRRRALRMFLCNAFGFS